MDPLPELEPLDVPELLRRYNLRPSKRLGQNFLVDVAALKRIVQAAAVEPGDTVLEVGPGLGSLTRYLAAAAEQVIAVELDKRLIPPLEAVLAGYPNLHIVNGDILDLEPAELVSVQDYLVVANIPYYITSALIRHLLEAQQRPRRMVLTVQLEVAQRICAGPGEMSLLSLSVQVYGAVQIAARIPAGAFYPVPGVDSAALRVDIYPQPIIPEKNIDVFFQLVKASFSQKRKTLRNSLAGGMGWKAQLAADLLEGAGIDHRRRAQTLSLQEWKRISEVYANQLSADSDFGDQA